MTSMSLESKLEHIRRVREFGEEIGLKFDRILSRYDEHTKKQDLHYLVVTAPNSLKAHVDKRVIGDDNSLLVTLKKSYKNEGYDTLLDCAQGWSRGNITDTLLKQSYIDTIDTVLHEGWHKTSGLTETNLDESVADAIGSTGAIEYCRLHRISYLDKAIKEREQDFGFANFINKYYDLLSDAYKRENWEELKFEIMKAAKEEGRMFKVRISKINNAFFCDMRPYCRYSQLANDFLDAVGLEEGIRNLKRHRSNKGCIKMMEEVVGGR